MADAIQLWFENGAADGFNIMPAVSTVRVSKHSLTTWCRCCGSAGCSAREYTGSTLREHYGLERPHRSQIGSLTSGAARLQPPTGA